MVPQNIHTPTVEGIGNSGGQGGSKTQKITEGWGLNRSFNFHMPFKSTSIKISIQLFKSPFLLTKYIFHMLTWENSSFNTAVNRAE